MSEQDIRIGAYYSNGEFGNRWSVRQVVRICEDEGRVRYKIVVGPDRRKEFVCETDTFAAWVKYEVVRNDSTWERID